MKTPGEITEQYLGASFDAVDASTQLVARHLAARKPISRKPWKKLEEEASLGQRAADRVAKFGGSWTFIMIFGGVMVVWVVINSVLLRTAAFDPYPYILLNLFLSMLASIQAPVILMSQNRQGEKDRVNAEHDYEVNLKAEMEILSLHEKIDLLRERQWEELIAIQKEQIRMISMLVELKGRDAGRPDAAA
jgi:uncharacterized membrane protein